MEIVIIACIIYISLNIYICNTCIKINKIEIKNSKIPKEFDGFKIAQLSDLHSEYKGKENINILKSIEKINPDIIVTTGDMIDKNDKNFDSYISLLNKLNKKYNIYSVGGNNEIALPYEKYKEYKSKSIKAHGLIIDNKKIELQKGKSKINIYGIRYKHNLTAKNKKEKNEYILEKSIGEVIEKEYNIVLAHNP